MLIVFTHWLQWIGDRRPGRRGGGMGMQGPTVSIELGCSPTQFDDDPRVAAHQLLQAENRFLADVGRRHPAHVLVQWQARRGTIEGPVLSEFRSGFTASE